MADQDRFEDRLAMALARYADEAPEQRGLTALAESVTGRPQRRGFLGRLAGAGPASPPIVGATRSSVLIVAWLVLLVLLIASVVAGVAVVGGWLRSNEFSVVPTASPSPTPTAVSEAPRSTAPTPTSTVFPVSPVPTALVTPSPIASVPSEELLVAGSMSVCADLSQKPLSFVDSNGNPAGLDVDIARAIAGQLGLHLEVVDTSFYTNRVFDVSGQVSQAVTSGTCDMAVAADPYGPGPIGREYANVIPYLDLGDDVLESIYVPFDHLVLADTLDVALRSLVQNGAYYQIFNSWNQSGYFQTWPVASMTVYHGLPGQLDIEAKGLGTGYVMSDPPGIVCGIPFGRLFTDTCAATYYAGMQITLSALPDPNSVFTGWSVSSTNADAGACTGTGDCVVTLTPDYTWVTVHFTPSAEQTP